MGLKTTNYEVKALGITIPEAYAVVKAIKAERGNGVATIGVSTTRENAISKQPLETKEIQFSYDIDADNPVAKAYEAAKAQKTVKRFDRETKEMADVVVNMPFYGWTDDIV